MNQNILHSYLVRLENIGKSITHKPIKIIFEQEVSSLIAFTDGQNCYINTANQLSCSFASQEDYLNSLYGLAFHEFGHIIVPNIKERKIWTEKLNQGYLEVEMPNTMKVALTDKNMTVRQLAVHMLQKIGYYLHNGMDDIFIETKMCNLYPGLCKKTIRLNRERFNFLLEQQLYSQEDESEIEKFLKIFLFYNSSSGGRIVKEIFKACYEKFDFILEKIPKMNQTEQDNLRWSFINEILVALWPNIEEKLLHLIQYNETMIKGILSKKINQESFPLESNNLKIYEIHAEQIGSLLKNVSNQTMDKTERNKQLQSKVYAIDYGTQNESIDIQISYPQIKHNMPAEYETERQKMVESIKRLCRLIQNIKKGTGKKQKGQYMGRKLNVKSIYRPDKRIFSNHNNPKHKTMAMVLLIDESESMETEKRIEYARKAAILIYEVSSKCHIPLAVYGHKTKLNTVQIDVFTEFNHTDTDKWNLMAINAAGANRDGMALRYAGEILAKRKEEIKLLILISDGQPYHIQEYYGEKAKKDLRTAKMELERKGITLFSAAIGEDKELIEDIYGTGYLDISDIHLLPECLMNLIINYI